MIKACSFLHLEQYLFLYSLLVLYMNIYICYHIRKKVEKKIIFKTKNLQPIISVESDAKMSKCRTLIMLISPTLVLAIIPIFLSFIIKNLIFMTFLIFFGFSSLAMSVSDIYFFIVILLKMRNNELFYQEDNKIYIFKK